MARIRSIKPEFFDDEDIARLTAFARLCFQGLWCHADRAGRIEDRPERLKVRIFPYDKVNIDTLLDELASGRFIIRYVVDGKRYIQVRSFLKHQRPNSKEAPSTYPAPIQNGPSTVLDTPQAHSRQRGMEVGNGDREGKGNGDSSESLSRSEPPPPPPEPQGKTALRFPTVGPQKSWALAETQVAEWCELFPTSDVMAECRAALAWLLANPPRQKTARGMPTFLVSWISRSNDRRGATSTASVRGSPPSVPDNPKAADLLAARAAKMAANALEDAAEAAVVSE